MKRWIGITLGVLAVGALSMFFSVRCFPAEDPGHMMIMSLLNQMESHYARIQDYTAIFHKQERVGGRLLPEEQILLKFRKPLNVYMKWIREPHKGREALYVQGENDNKVIAHRGGLFGFLTLSLDPKGSLAMEGNRHPITEVGFGHLIEGLRKDIQTAVENGELEVIRLEEERFQGRPGITVEARPVPRSGRKYYASRMICHIDKELMLPVGVAFYDKEDQLFEKYSYDDVKLNVGLTSLDFSRDNADYGF